MLCDQHIRYVLFLALFCVTSRSFRKRISGCIICVFALFIECTRWCTVWSLVRNGNRQSANGCRSNFLLSPKCSFCEAFCRTLLWRAPFAPETCSMCQHLRNHSYIWGEQMMSGRGRRDEANIHSHGRRTFNFSFFHCLLIYAFYQTFL